MKNLVTGGAGFVGSNLIDRLLATGEEVICLDNFVTGSKKNIDHLKENKNFTFIEHDVIDPIEINVNKIWHLACPGSSHHYQRNPIKTSKTNFLGTYNMLGLAKKYKAKFLLASTSEVYGDPEIHPQPESYNGSVNPIGIRSCYDEGKRIAEALSFDYYREHSVDIRIARIFNTYGPRMLPNDGRVISNFICQSLLKGPLTIYGNGAQTRSFCYVDDLITGLIKLMNSEFIGPFNFGSTEEYKIIELAQMIINIIDPNLKLIAKELPQDDPSRRKPEIKLANSKLNWKPSIDLKTGLIKTINYFKEIY